MSLGKAIEMIGEVQRLLMEKNLGGISIDRADHELAIRGAVKILRELFPGQFVVVRQEWCFHGDDPKRLLWSAYVADVGWVHDLGSLTDAVDAIVAKARAKVNKLPEDDVLQSASEAVAKASAK